MSKVPVSSHLAGGGAPHGRNGSDPIGRDATRSATTADGGAASADSSALDRERLVDEFLTEAAEAVAGIADEVAALAADFTCEDVTPGQEGLTRLTVHLREFVIMVGVLRGPLEIDERRLTVAGMSLDTQIASLSGWLQSMIDAQGSRNWLAIADVLEHQLQPFLRAWPAALLACRAQARPPSASATGSGSRRS